MEFSSIENQFISDLELLANNECIDQTIILKSIVKLLFCAIKQISNLPFHFKNIQKEISENINQEFQIIHNDMKIINEKIEQNQNEVKNINKNLFKPKDLEPDIFKACKEGKLTSVEWLIEKENVDKNIKVDKSDYKNSIWKDDTPIHIASKNGHFPIVQYLIENQNVDIEIKGYDEWTPLHNACWRGHLPIVEYLISKGANIEAKDTKKNGWTPLFFASRYGKTDIVKYLVSKGANKNARDEDGRTPYDYADKYGIRNILK